ncbi:helix-turn-helix domain-containing protein [Methylobacterium dankookense]|uniref:Nitrogen fixation regulation protein FixK n=1 Tax=Methylobacterium dankookense TaxID=560405 RepID=A0A564FSF5_9HYPH|nr:helix-turn-helix domain-containing protein [Methylobacterium dankookense]GJD56882.1 Nitrogen fixation regulation protein FixK [Methylobacterium dankookense]VUF10714.1 Nitrogen fixation regulation protein FixK [Methylobacterium dankookense]
MQTALATTPRIPSIAPGLRIEAASRPETQRGFGAGEEIFAEGDRAGFFYRVASGTVRTCRLLPDGRRQIDAFHLPGDIFGVEAGTEHRFGAEAVGEVRVIAYRRERMLLTGEDGPLAREVAAATLRALARAQDQMMLLGRKSARERIASFLLDLAERMADGPSGHLRLPMPRTDMADHLGLTVESVSRCLTQLERDGLIALSPDRHSVRLRDRAALRHLDA